MNILNLSRTNEKLFRCKICLFHDERKEYLTVKMGSLSQ